MRIIEDTKIPRGVEGAKVVLIPKKDRKPENPRSFKPLCLLNTVRKLYQALIRSKLGEEMKEREGLAENNADSQREVTYGFNSIHANSEDRCQESCKNTGHNGCGCTVMLLRQQT